MMSLCVCANAQDDLYADSIRHYELAEINVTANKVSSTTPMAYSAIDENQIKEKEGERILSKVPDSAYVVALAIEGKQLDSEELAEKMEKWNVNGVSHLVFIIGGSLGLTPKVLNRADFKLSFSKMTFPHQLMRVILIEQIYRSFTIINNKEYHK